MCVAVCPGGCKVQRSLYRDHASGSRVQMNSGTGLARTILAERERANWKMHSRNAVDNCSTSFLVRGEYSRGKKKKNWGSAKYVLLRFVEFFNNVDFTWTDLNLWMKSIRAYFSSGVEMECWISDNPPGIIFGRKRPNDKTNVCLKFMNVGSYNFFKQRDSVNLNSYKCVQVCFVVLFFKITK